MKSTVCALVLLLVPSAYLRLVGKSADSVHRPGRSNILLIYVDNLGYGDLGCYGNADVLTPNLDRLAAEGARCTDFYVVTSSCTPSRGALLTGRYPRRNGLMHQLVREENWHGVGLAHDERLIPQYLKAAGYATGCFGKWNIGFAPGSRPTERGFDEFLGFRSGNIHYFQHTYGGEMDMRRGTEPVDLTGQYATDVLADATIDFITRHRDRPWFAYVPMNAVHFVSAVNTEPGEMPVWQVPAEYLARYGHLPDEADPRKRFRAVLTALDDGIGRVLKALDDTAQRDKTLVIFISDNGAFMLKGRGLEVQSNAPFRDGGTTVYEGGVRVPALFRWPGKIAPGSVCQTMLSHLDILPLCLAVAGLPLPDDRTLDGRDPRPALTGTNPVSPHEYLVFDYAGHFGLRHGHLKIVRRKAATFWELYDLATDPAEAHDRAETRPRDVVHLDTLFHRWQRQGKQQ
jgi:arylsulfatase A-like enzyme